MDKNISIKFAFLAAIILFFAVIDTGLKYVVVIKMIYLFFSND